MDGILIINKEKDYTSRDVVNKLTKILHTKKIGHTGTLDPLATGVLVITIGKATKLCNLLTSEYKEYIATMKLGVETDTLDITGNIIEEKSYSVNEEQIKEVLNTFLGKSIQEVPKYSAVKINGKRLYEYARKNIPIELPKREIDIKHIELISYKGEQLTFKCEVSKGTYIRSLIRDISYKLNTVGTMTELIRTKQGDFCIEHAYSLEDIEKNKYRIVPYEEALKNYEIINIDRDIYNKVINGAIIDKVFKNKIALLKYKGNIIAIYQEYSKDKTKAKPYIMLITK